MFLVLFQGARPPSAYTSRPMRCLRLLVALLAFPLFAGERYIVEFRGAPAAARGEAGIDRERVRREYTRVLHGVAIELREGESIDSIARLPQVARVTRDWEVEAFETGAAPAQVRAVTVHGGGAGIVVAVIDSGIDYNHPALGGGFGAGRKVAGGFDFVNDDGDPMDDNRHGTHVAGIIAGQSAAVTGVAPQARLLAYKVLGADGRGLTSDIIAAIDRAVEDGADVINLSLGGFGSPDDPLARAVETAVAQGVVVVAAAGNEGLFHAIGSPAGAPSAITVGAVDRQRAHAEFSSAGPATQSGAIKPDVLALGVGVVSSVPGGGTLALSGTSMAAPYVSGVAALLREQHPEWTPERVRAAVITTALPVAGAEVMAQGSGTVDLTRAAASELAASPTQINFGLNGTTGDVWESRRTVSVYNDATESRTLRASVTGNSPAIAVSVAPAEVAILPGESREIEVTVQVDNALLGFPQTSSLAFGGMIALEGEPQTIRLPWAFLRAARVTISDDRAFPNAMWRRLQDGYESFAPLGPGAIELLLRPGRYDFAVLGEDAEDVRLFIVENRLTEDDVRLAFTAADAPHEIRLEGAPPVPMADESLHTVRARLVFPEASGSVVLPELAGRTMHASSFSAQYEFLATESFVDAIAGVVAIAQHEPVRGLGSSVTLRREPHEYDAQRVEVRFPDGTPLREVVIMPRDWPRRPTEFGGQPPSVQHSVPAEIWSGTLYMTPEVHEDFAGGLQLAMITSEDERVFRGMTTPMIRRDAEGFFSARGFEVPAAPIYATAGETMRFGEGPVRPPARWVAGGGVLVSEGTLRGSWDEVVRASQYGARYRLLNSAHVELRAGEIVPGTLSVPLPEPGRYRAEVRTHARAAAVLEMDFDTAGGEVALPSITWLSLHDAVGRRASRLPYLGNASLVFAAQNVVATRSGVFVRRTGTAAWVQLTPVETAVDPVAGSIFRVDLRDALRFQGRLDLRIEIGDAHGNTSTWQHDAAFEVTAEPARTRRRAVR